MMMEMNMKMTKIRLYSVFWPFIDDLCAGHASGRVLGIS